MNEKTTQQPVDERTGGHRQFEESDWITTESGDYLLNPTDGDSGVAEVHLVSLKEDNDGCRSAVKVLQRLTQNVSFPVSGIDIRQINDNYIVFHVTERSVTSQRQSLNREVVDFLTLEI
jgi:hypothetical protein